MPGVNYGVCAKCRKRVPAKHAIRDGKVYLIKDCPDCGITESLASSRASAWQRKRDICHYDAETAPVCHLNCTTCSRQAEHRPRMVFVDVTNRCDMNCPICIANIPRMGFVFHPPLPYFENVFDGLSKLDPKPAVHLFGGEPAVRKDLFEIIRMAQEKGLSVGVETNGLRLADEAYCRKLCETGVRVLLGFDGRDPRTYEKLRGDASACGKKLKALENLKKCSTRKQTIMCCVARGVNDTHLRDLIDFCHENRDFISNLHLIPLTETWKEGEFETDVHTTIEDVEQIVDDAFPGENVEFVPMHLAYHLNKALRFFGGVRMTFGEVHPNCESGTTLFSDGNRYRPVGHYLNRPLAEICEEMVTRIEQISGRLDRLDHHRALQRLRGRVLVARKFAGLLLGSLDLRVSMKGNRFLSILRLLGGLVIGKSLSHQFRKHTNFGPTMDMIILPFEEYHSLDGARLCHCKGGFAYEDPDDGVVKTIPICSWSLFQEDIERKISEKYGDALAAAAS